ncbi:hinge domain of cleavage stimulation factor subunit 2-domain-containing protein [Apiosordaria backusii]|uniref:Hinge domain of cleavage stimulation factor subunit 2-domain-containing protein n=1 Tax=Apiosordaria backusii TaxID=314023 RepID=A0AA40EZ78_9PEZI|nr:hinge domain of cleavage stimulation factor subunit 2-domain-containing protein [Apiosordaria backusii]
MSSRQPSRVVFVGNIPYGLTEEQITEIFSGAGRVLNFRLVYDRETGRPKGFGFAEFPDHDSASSAVRNLNDYEIMGRKLRVDFSNETVSDDDGRDRDAGVILKGPSAPSYPAPSNGNNVAAPVVAAGGSSLPPLPQGKDLPPGVSCTDAISRTLRTLPPAQLLDIIQQMKTLATNDPARCAELLNQAPQLSYAVFQALLIMGLVSPDAINSVLDTGVSVAPPPAAAPAPYGSYTVPAATGTPVGGYVAPPVAAPVVPVPVAAPPPPVAAPPPAQDAEALMRAVMELPQETIDMLPEAEKQQILALRAQFSLQGHR